MGLDVEIISTPELGNRSYVVHDATLAIVVDPQRDIDRIETLLETKGLQCRAVLETHIHNDYVTGGAELARRSDCQYVVNRDDPVRFDRTPIGDQEQLTIGDLRVTAIATPGHTDTHLAYVIDSGEDAGALFTGGSLLFGSVGRTDLVAPDRTEDLTRKQYRSVHRLAGLPADTRVFPTHGFGSFCSAGPVVRVDSSKIADELQRNDALTARDETSFVVDLIGKLGPYPTYYRHMAPRNLDGPGPVNLRLPGLLDTAATLSAARGPGWVVDLRERKAHAHSHIRGSIGVELNQSFSTYLGWILPWGIELTLVADTADAILEARRQLIRIGVDDIVGGHLLNGAAPEAVAAASYSVTTFAHLAEVIGYGEVILDTRQRAEHLAESIPRAVNIPLHQLEDRLADIPDGEIWVHCASGYRASIAASMLSRAGRSVTLVDDTFDNAIELGLTADRTFA